MPRFIGRPTVVQAVVTSPGEWIRYSSPEADGLVRYIFVRKADLFEVRLYVIGDYGVWRARTAGSLAAGAAGTL